MTFELLLIAMDRTWERPTLNTPSVAKRSFGGLEIFDGSKPMILPLSIERPSQHQSRTQSYKVTDLV